MFLAKKLLVSDNDLIWVCLITSARYDQLGRVDGCVFPIEFHVIESADKHQQKAAHEGKKLEMD